MLYKGCSIQIWKSEWIGSRISGEYYSLDTYYYRDLRTPEQQSKYIAIVDEVNPRRGCQVWGGSTPLIAIDLAKFSIDLRLSNYRRRDVEERFRRHNEKCLKDPLEKRLGSN